MNDNSPMLARMSAFVLWAFVAGAAMFWGLRLLVRPAPAPVNAVSVNESAVVRADLSRLLGAETVPVVAAAPAESTRFKLLGVMAGKALASGTTPGFALISVDGKPPRTFAAGSQVDAELVLQTLSMRTASLGPAQGPAAFVLEVPPLTAAATGTLAAAPSQPAAAPPAAMRPENPAGPGRGRLPGGRPEAVR